MKKDELRELLHQEYKTENWKKVTEFVFPNVQYLQRPQAIPFSNDKVESFKQIGNVKLTDGKNLAMFEVKVAKNVNLARNRVELRKLVENLIDKERNHGVLVIYEQGKEDYRFTFTAKSTEFDEVENDFVDLESDAKRFTYILGKNESCKTAANRFWELSTHKDTATIKDVENAFSVERLNKEFFNKYKEFYEDFVQYITGKRFVKEKGKWVEKKIGRAEPIHKKVFNSDDKLARNFVKLLLGRLVFIQFLQKKGWMGVPATSKQWKNGDPDFLLNLFNTTKSKEEFHSKCLYPLFYKAFNTPDRPNDVFALTGNRVPYLNGGLFENENPKTKEIDFPDTYFANMLDFFDQYNFTIDENDPLDHEVGIDPEMLGHIFENLLEDNKDKGAFYTPKPIVQYMCQESLIQYLKTYLQEHQVWPEEEDAASQTETNLQNFVRKKIAGELLNDYEEHLARALKEVKICDPAIGSGAFPMGLLNEIFQCVQLLYGPGNQSTKEVWEMEEWAPDIVKKNIIQHSIYGVDIEKGAVDIARLRFWLSLIVDEQEPTPLPNLDFKIMQGNSLLESYEGIDLSKIAGTKTVVTEVALDLFGNPVNAQANIFDTKYIDDSNITELIDSYFNTQLPDKKQRLKKEIDNIIHKHIDYNLEFEENKIFISIAEIKKNLSLLKSDKNHSTAVAAKTKKAREKLSKDLENFQEELENLKAKRRELHDLQKTAERPYFLWHLFFKDVFDKGGFDIVIGNPPYVNFRDFKSNIEKRHYLNGYKTAEYQSDLFILFIEKGYTILKKNLGSFAFIIPNSITNNLNNSKIRKFILTESDITSLVNTPTGVFESATVDTIILISCLNRINANVKTYNYSKTGFILLDIKEQKHFAKNNNYDFDFLTSQFNKSIISKIEIDTVILDEICDSTSGIKEYEVGKGNPPQTEDDCISKVFNSNIKKSKAYREHITGSEIDNFIIKYTGQHLKYGEWLAAPRNPFFFEPIEKIIIREIPGKVRLKVAYTDKNYTVKNTAHVFVPKEEYNAKYLCAVLNSTLMGFYFTNKFSERDNVFPKVKIGQCRMLPIKKILRDEQKPFIEIINKIIKLRIANKETSTLERQLDLIVYRLYDLSFSEIITFDETFDYSEDDYSSLTTIS